MSMQTMFAALIEEDPGPSSPASASRFRILRRDAHSTSPPPPSSSASGSSTSCVTRETSEDDCAYSRFIVWAAVKRNSSGRMSDAERLECPLLRCRKQYTDHESMLRHLAVCPQLATREYWCFEHERCERFDDYKTCKRCLGHPSRRRKMLQKAKHFFSSLGHKSHNTIELDFDLSETLLPPPSYYESLDVEPPHDKAELSSTEIVEIDSTEVPSPPPVQRVQQVQLPQPTQHISTQGVDPQDLLLPELDSTMISSDSLMQWQPTPSVVEPLNGHSFSIGPKPCLSVTTHGFEQFTHARPVAQPVSVSSRSKHLSPSSSVRSTTSTTSTDSATSTTSMTSNSSSMVSPASVWSVSSNPWLGIDTRLTSPSTDLLSPGGFFSNDMYDVNQCDNICSSDFLHDVFFELPADEVPIFEMSSDPALSTLDSNRSIDFLCTTTIDSNAVLPESPKVQPTEVRDLTACCSETKSIMVSVWDALQEHIVSSLAKIENIGQNPLANQLRSFSAKTIAHNGLRTLRNILDGQTVTSASDALCFIHIVYSLSLVVYEDETMSQSRDFFAQSLAISAQFTPEVQNQYKEVVKAIWQPGDLSASQLREQETPLHRFVSNKGKQPEAWAGSSSLGKADSQILAAQHFLDELETSALLGDSFEVLTSDLCAKHFQDRTIATSVGSPFAVTIDYMLNVVLQKFSGALDLKANLGLVRQKVSQVPLYSIRRFELQALRAGKSCVAPATYFSEYVPFIRRLCDPIYEQHGSGESQRHNYYLQTITLGEALIAELDNELGAGVIDDPALDDFCNSLTTAMNEEFKDTEPLLSYPAGLSGVELSTEDTKKMAQMHSKDESSTVDISQSNASPASDEQTQLLTQQKMEADACCEICGYRPKGDPRWFHGSMHKHRKLQHSAAPPEVFKCPYPGCPSTFTKRADNLRQHQLDKGHFVGEEANSTRRPSKKRKKLA